MQYYLIEVQHDTGTLLFSISVPEKEYLVTEVLRYLREHNTENITHWEISREIDDIRIIPSINEDERRLLQKMVTAQEQDTFHQLGCCICGEIPKACASRDA